MTHVADIVHDLLSHSKQVSNYPKSRQTERLKQKDKVSNEQKMVSVQKLTTNLTKRRQPDNKWGAEAV